MSEPIQLRFSRYEDAPCKVKPARDEKGRVNHWVQGLVTPPKGERRSALAMALRAEHALWVAEKEKNTQLAMAKEFGLHVTFVNKMVKGEKRSDKVDAEELRARYNHWLEIDSLHAPHVVCRREGVGRNWYDKNVVKPVGLEKMNAGNN